MLIRMKKELISCLLSIIYINISPIKAQSDDSEGGSSEGEAYAALGILCALAILFIIICADIIHKRFQSNREWWYPQLDTENTLIGRNPNEPQTVTLKMDKNEKILTNNNNNNNQPIITSNIEMTEKDDNNPLLQNNDNDVKEQQQEQKKDENEEKDLTEKELLAIQKKDDPQKKRVSANTEFLASAWQEEVDEMEEEDKMASLDGVRVSVNARLIQTQRPSQVADTPQSTAL
mmetsp:Transcript_14156/g.12685  ORF Transcript_14156/g.12685 Transcript_14156/m.12685 type:complete len:233 (+) Transcript_14156:144-842(+)